MKLASSEIFANHCLTFVSNSNDDDAKDDGVQVRMQMERGVVEGVELGQSYAVRVRARNAAGWSPWSIESEQLVCKHKVSTHPAPPILFILFKDPSCLKIWAII